MAGEKINGIDIEVIIDKIKRAVVSADAKNIKITGFELTLKTLVISNAGGGLKFQIPLINADVDVSGILKNQISQEVHLKFGELLPEEKKRLREISVDIFDLKDDLYSVIISIEKAVITANNKEPKFDLEDAYFDLNFIMGSESKINLIIKSETTMEWANNLKVIFGPV